MINKQPLKENEKIVKDGEVTFILPNAVHRITLDNGHEVLAHASGKMRLYNIKIMVGDKVRVELPPDDLTRGRIVYRYK